MDYIFTLMPAMMESALTTLKVFALTLVFSLPLGILLSLCRLSKINILDKTAQTYIWIMRGTPLLLQLIFVFFGLPIMGITLNRMTAALAAFSLNYGAYFAEIFRAGIQSIDKGQYEAAHVLGLSPSKTFTRIIFPQMVKRVIPPAANEVITLVKDTSLVYVVGLGELLRAGKIASNRDASLVPLIVVAVLYLVLTAVLTKGFKNLEKSYEYYQ